MHIILDAVDIIHRQILRMGAIVDFQVLCTTPIQEILSLLF